MSTIQDGVVLHTFAVLLRKFIHRLLALSKTDGDSCVQICSGDVEVWCQVSHLLVNHSDPSAKDSTDGLRSHRGSEKDAITFRPSLFRCSNKEAAGSEWDYSDEWSQIYSFRSRQYSYSALTCCVCVFVFITSRDTDTELCILHFG